MPDIKVLSENYIFSLKVDGTYYPIFCAKSVNFPIDQDAIEITNVNSGPVREYTPGQNTATISASGITEINNSEGRISPFYLKLLATRRAIQDLRVLATSNNGVQLAITFRAFITHIETGKDVGSFSNASVTFQITGGITFSDVIPGPGEPVCEVQDPLYVVGIENEYIVQSSFLRNEDGLLKTILEVQREGTGHDETESDPGNRQFRYTADSDFGYIEFDDTNPFNPGGETIYILYKIQTE